MRIAMPAASSRLQRHISETIARNNRAFVQYFKGDPDRIVGWGMLIIFSVVQGAYGIFW